MIFNGLLQEAQEMLDRFHWQYGAGPDNGPENGEGRIAIVGLPEAGKKTLCNSLWGWQVLGEEQTAETFHDFGLFTVADLSANTLEADATLFQLESADLLVYVLDGTKGLRTEDFQWIARLRSLRAPTVVTLNKVDQLDNETLIALQDDLQKRLASPIVPLSANQPKDVHNHFLPVILKACPELAVPLAATITSLRRHVARNLVQQSSTLSWLLSLEPMPLVDVSSLVGLQMQMVKRLAAVYGHHQANASWAMALITVFSMVLRSVARFAAEFTPFAGWLVAAFIGASGTWTLGQAALIYYEAERPWNRNHHEPAQATED